MAVEFINSYTLLASFLLALVYYWYKRTKNSPPGPRGYPVVGVVPMLGKYPEKDFDKWSEDYGAIMSVRMGSKDMVVLNDWDSIQKAFVNQSTKFSGRAHSPFIDQIHHGYGITFLDYGKLWKKQREFSLSTLKGFGVGKHSMESKIIEEISIFIEAVKTQNEKPFNISFLLQSAISNIICKVFFGKRYDYYDSEFKKLHGFLKNLDDPTLNSMISLFQLAPFFMKIPPFSGYNKKIVDDIKTAEDMIDGIIEEHKKEFDEDSIQDFIDAFLLEINRNTDPSFSVKQLTHYILDHLFNGTKTIASILYWSLLCLLHYPETQKRLRKEIMDVIGLEGNVCMHKRPQLPYTCAFMEEVLRFCTLFPLAIPHAVTEDAMLGGYCIPKGTMVIGNLWAVHNNKATWKKPEVFNPDRFLNEKGEFVKSPHVIPFSVGPRHCLGEHLALMEFFTFLVSLVQRYEFFPDPKADTDTEMEGINGFVYLAKPFKLIAKEIEKL